jgi:hypothetical protein
MYKTVEGAFMVEWLRLLTSNHLPCPNPDMDYEEAIQLAYRTWVVLLRCPFVPEIIHGRASYLHQKSSKPPYDLYCVGVTYTQPKKMKKTVKMNKSRYNSVCLKEMLLSAISV